MASSNLRWAGLAAIVLSLAAGNGSGPSVAFALPVAAAAPPSASTAPLRRATASASAGADDTDFVPGTLCTRPDQVVLSCPLEHTDKIVSICAAGAAAPHQFYYAFGTAGRPELVYPPKGDHAMAPLRRTSNIYAGGTGSEEFSFHRGGFEYIAYSISGKSFSDAGVLVRRTGADDAAFHSKCDKARLVESNNLGLTEELVRLEPEPDLEGGLPYYPPEDER